MSKVLPEVHHALCLPAGEVGLGKKTVDFCDRQQESKHMVRPSLSRPHNFNTNRTVSLCIVIVDRMPILEVVVHHFRIAKRLHPSHTIVLPFASRFLVAPRICPVGGHQ